MNFKGFVSPQSRLPLKVHVEKLQGSKILSGYFYDEKGQKFFIEDAIPHFTYPSDLNRIQKEQLEYYESLASNYDQLQNLTFEIQRENEKKVRKEMVQSLNLKSTDKVLEIACGTGLDSINIVERLGEKGELHALDISCGMLKECRKKLSGATTNTHFVVANGSFLPYPDQYFDAIFSFGGFNVFEDPKKSLSEMVRVTKIGGRIVFGDESMPPWLKDTEFAKILIHSNPLFKYELPLEILPIEARNVSVKWIIGGVYYLISFDVGQGEPTANFDLPIPGKRGGTLNTRFYGQLEGVQLKTKQKVIEMAQRNSMSIHDWLETTLESILEQEEAQNHV